MTLIRKITPKSTFGKIVYYAILVAAVFSAFWLSNLLQDDHEDLTSDRYYNSKNAEFSFFVAGHTYGRCCPTVNNDGLHPPFKDSFEIIRAVPRIEFGVLTGDVVATSTEQNWNEVDRDIDDLKIPVYIAPGNHDYYDNPQLFSERYGNTYRAFVHRSNLFVILDSNIDLGRISADQLEFLRETLENVGSVSNIYIFVHHVLWWTKNNSFGQVRKNYARFQDTSPNFWTAVEPLLRETRKNVYVFAGDFGGIGAQLPTYFHYDNIRLIVSGMGGGKNDNILVVTVNSDETVHIDIVWLNEPKSRNISIEDLLPGR